VHACDVYSARRCLRGLQAGPFDLVLLDWDAMEVDRELLLDCMCLMRPRPTLAVTSACLDETVCRNAAARSIFVVPKPRDPGVMGVLIAQLMPTPAHLPAGVPDVSVTDEIDVLGPGLTVDVAGRYLRDERGSMSLRRGEVELLRYLSARRGAWVPTDAIARNVFGRSDPASHNLVWRYISDLRRKLGDNSYIFESARSRGYRVRRLD